MCIYIQTVNGIVTVGGQAATEQMLADGWTAYEGEIPQCDYSNFEYLVLEDGVLVVKSDVRQQQNAVVENAKKLLADTDYKMTVDYFATLSADEQAELTAKRAHARTTIRDAVNPESPV